MNMSDNQTTMSHEQAVSSQAAERYLLGELKEDELEAFEGHYFDCPACFQQIEMGSQFLGRAREVLDPEPEKGWLARMLGDLSRPAPAFVAAMLLCAVGIGVYQQFELADSRAPRIGAHLVLAPARGESSGKVIRVPHNGPVSLSLDFTPQPEFTSYRAQILSESKKVKLDFAVLPQTSDSSLAHIFDANQLDPGKYSVVIFGVTSSGETKRIGESRFELQFTD